MSKKPVSAGDVMKLYIKPIGEFTNEVLSRMCTDDQCFKGIVCGDGRARNLWNVTSDDVKSLEESRKNDSKFRFSVWYKDKKSGDIKPWKGDFEPSSELRHSLTDGCGNLVKFPRKRRRVRPKLLWLN
jgi:hypothetical protein